MDPFAEGSDSEDDKKKKKKGGNKKKEADPAADPDAGTVTAHSPL